MQHCKQQQQMTNEFFTYRNSSDDFFTLENSSDDFRFRQIQNKYQSISRFSLTYVFSNEGW